MQKTKNSVYNAIITLISTGVASILSLISTNLIIRNYGSDFNGVVATANQLINVLMLVEGGFTLAINVALFKYYANEKENENNINSILAAANKIFTKIGIIFLILGIILTLVYGIFIKSNLDYTTIIFVFLMIVFSTFFNIIFTTKFRIMFQTAQREYKISFIGLIVNNISSIITIILVYFKVNLLLVRASIMIFNILNGVIIYLLYRREFPRYRYKGVEPDYSEIKGTKDIMAQKITGALYSSAPIFFISTFVSTTLASIYSVYNSVYSIARMILSSIISSPTNGFGLLLIEQDKTYVYDRFQKYEYIVMFIINVLVTPILIMIIPFFTIYTRNITDVNYIDYRLAYMMAIILTLEMIHIPSGNIINISGNFKTAKNIQYITMGILIVALLIGSLGELYGILIGTIITNVILAYLEIRYVHKKYFGASMTMFFKKIMINVILAIGLNIIFNLLKIQISGYVAFFGVGILIFILTTLVILLVNYIFFKEDIKFMWNMVKGTIFKRKSTVASN